MGGDGRHVVAEPGLDLLEELDRIVEPAIDEVDRLAVEALEPGCGRLARDLGRVAHRVEYGELGIGGAVGCDHLGLLSHEQSRSFPKFHIQLLKALC